MKGIVINSVCGNQFIEGRYILSKNVRGESFTDEAVYEKYQGIGTINDADSYSLFIISSTYRWEDIIAFKDYRVTRHTKARRDCILPEGLYVA